MDPVDREAIEVEAPQTLFSNTDDNNGNGNEVAQETTRYGKGIAKAILFALGIFAVCLAIGYGSGYGVNNKLISNKNKAASVSSAKNADFVAYDDGGPSSSKTSKSSSEGTKAAKDTKSSKSCNIEETNVGRHGSCCDDSNCDSGCQCFEGIEDSDLCDSGVDCNDPPPVNTCQGGYGCQSNRVLLYGDEDKLHDTGEDVSPPLRLQLIEDLAAKDDATFSVKHELISVESCDALVKHAEDSFVKDIASNVGVPVRMTGEDDFESWVLHGDDADELYHKKLHANELVDLIGKDETKKIIDMFHESFGDVPIDTVYLVRVGLPTGGLYWHKDTYESLEITLNDNYEGGDVLHLTALGVHKSNERTGTAIAHKDDIVHGVTPNKNGAKYTLILKHHPYPHHKEGVVRLSKEMVGEL